MNGAICLLFYLSFIIQKSTVKSTANLKSKGDFFIFKIFYSTLLYLPDFTVSMDARMEVGT
jgi:hypothetical protein